MANPFLKRPASPEQIKTEIREAIVEIRETDKMLLSKLPPETRPIDSDIYETDHAPETVDLDVEDSVESVPDRLTGNSKLSKLIDDDFPFDESQLAAIEGMIDEPYACLTGAAGTGKTTSTKKLVDRLLETVAFQEVNLAEYWKAEVDPADSDDEYERTTDWVPSLVMCSFTGRATQMTKKNFPRDWHGNIMTIHRMLGFVPEFYEDWDDDMGEMKNKMRFVPTYTADFKMPWDIILIDEAGMLGVELWHAVYAAMKPGCRVYMIGDINQLPPVHGKSIYGFALAKWPAWELTHVHRQQGKDNPIVDNAWRILNGRMPVSEGRFQMMPLLDNNKRPADLAYASRLVRGLLPQFKAKGIYDPIRDTVIVPINGEDGSRGAALGQKFLNQEMSRSFNPDNANPRYFIDSGRELKQFAIGDKVMATKNDWQAGITNGMTGIIVDIQENPGYAGDRNRVGPIEHVNLYMQTATQNLEHVEFTLDDLNEKMDAIDAGKAAAKEKKDRGPASHTVTVQFGTADHGFEIPFASLSEVFSLQMAYVVTCHKMQGGEAPTIIIILHDSHRSMLNREWLYTAVTRASEKCILLYSQVALNVALSKQSVKGATLKEKIQSFLKLLDPNSIVGAANVRLPESTNKTDLISGKQSLVPFAPARMTTQAEREGGLAKMIAAQRAAKEEQAKAAQQEAPKPIHIHVHNTYVVTEKANETETIDGGTIYAERAQGVAMVELPAPADAGGRIGADSRLLLSAPAGIPQWGAYRRLCEIDSDNQQLRLTHMPAPEPAKPVRVNPFLKMLKKP